MLPREAIELFHLAFLGALGGVLDKKLYAVKGGVNLRFFLGSPRASEDLDLDVQTIEPTTLRNKVDKLLRGKPLELRLGAKGIALGGFTAPKQTDVTQRWKVRLIPPAPSAEVRTKIEASRRGLDAGVQFGPVDPILIRAYGATPVMASHYGLSTAFGQKVSALAGRTETQARDVFDLDFLLRAGATAVPERFREEIPAAAANALTVSFDQFAGQVLPYLHTEEQAAWDQTAWEAAVLRVADGLEQRR